NPAIEGKFRRAQKKYWRKILRTVARAVKSEVGIRGNAGPLRTVQLLSSEEREFSEKFDEMEISRHQNDDGRRRIDCSRSQPFRAAFVVSGDLEMGCGRGAGI